METLISTFINFGMIFESIQILLHGKLSSSDGYVSCGWTQFDRIEVLYLARVLYLKICRLNLSEMLIRVGRMYIRSKIKVCIWRPAFVLCFSKRKYYCRMEQTPPIFPAPSQPPLFSWILFFHPWSARSINLHPSTANDRSPWPPILILPRACSFSNPLSQSASNTTTPYMAVRQWSLKIMRLSLIYSHWSSDLAFDMSHNNVEWQSSSSYYFCLP